MASGATGERSTARWIVALIFLAIIWGGSIPATKLGLRDFPPLTLTALRYLAAAPFFAVLLVNRKLPPLRGLMAMAALGVLGIAVGQVFQVLGVERTSASVATVLSATIPILVVLLVALRLRQPVGRRHALGLATAFAGVALVATGDPRDIVGLWRGDGIAGDALILASAVAIALYYALSIELVQLYSAMTVAAWTTLSGAVAMAPVLAWDLSRTPLAPSPTGIAVILYLALLVTVVGLWVWLQALERLPARVAASLQYLQPIVGVAASAAMFGDRLDVWFGVGTAFVFTGIALSAAPARRNRVTAMPGDGRSHTAIIES
jgi:O-acetylserine/cysteine efflux transporter